MWKVILIFAAGVVTGVVGSRYASGLERGYQMSCDDEKIFEISGTASDETIGAEG